MVAGGAVGVPPAGLWTPEVHGRAKARKAVASRALSGAAGGITYQAKRRREVRGSVRAHGAPRKILRQGLPESPGKVKKRNLLRSATEQHGEDRHLNGDEDPVRAQERHRYRPWQFSSHRHAHGGAVF